jgi:hypothetical protein
VYLAVVLFAAYSIIRIVASIDTNTVRQRLSGAVPERVGGGVLIGFGILFLFQAIGVLANATANLTAPTPQLAVAVADLVITPALIIGGVSLERHNSLGYVVGLSLLFQASMLFVGLIIFFLLQPLLATAPFAETDMVVIFTMGVSLLRPVCAVCARRGIKRDTARKLDENDRTSPDPVSTKARAGNRRRESTI